MVQNWSKVSQITQETVRKIEIWTKMGRKCWDNCSKWVKIGQNGNISEGKLENGPNWVKTEPNNAGNGPKNEYLSEMSRKWWENRSKWVKMAILAKLSLNMVQIEPNMAGNSNKNRNLDRKTGQNGEEMAKIAKVAEGSWKMV